MLWNSTTYLEKYGSLTFFISSESLCGQNQLNKQWIYFGEYRGNAGKCRECFFIARVEIGSSFVIVTYCKTKIVNLLLKKEANV